ncbi:hypothetical protein [Flavobacterium kingsejongi]|uniref:Uncharacterized protein n=1 Tax=Flavobacterium kingsejongi TaxID=1678728 RepID=A0A2S1LQK6_9FLAO|nr:hypothetical protein [Flavobacterium kingsejongi]AWG26035.1 hypothetical protein FK004_12765 [Flavobacterium kingsejongi]
MKTFEDLQNIWNQQTASDTKPAAATVIKKAAEHTKRIKRNHIWTRAILSLTAILLIAYYIWVGAYRQTQFSFGLCIMITMLLVRVTLEWKSVEKLETLKTDVTLIEYSKQANQFYQWRKKIHYIFTPIIYLAYIAGFILLLPVFKEIFSQGFYLYIVLSGFGFLLIFGLLMVRIIKKEIQLLDFLKNIS